MIRVLTFFRLIDLDHGQLSLTDVATYIVLIKLIMVPNPSIVDLGTLLGVLLARSYRRYLTSSTDDGTVH